MPKSTIFFLGVLSFLAGIVFASIGLSFLSCLVPAAVLFGVFLVWETEWEVALLAAVLLALGSFYFWQSGSLPAARPAEPVRPALVNSIDHSFQKLLPAREAALLSGLTLGINTDFTKSFKDNLSLSGLRHLTTISGWQVAVVVFIFFNLSLYFWPRRYAFIFTFAFVFILVALAGFNISAVRSAILALMVGLAYLGGRLASPHNIIALAALVFALVNPKVLIFDVGFQLSFLAVLSIVYLSPVLANFLEIKGNGWGGIKQSFLATVSVQLAIAPVVMANFKNFSLTGWIANLLVLPVTPFIFGLGWLVALLSFIFYPLAYGLSFAVAPLVEYVILMVNLFSKLAIRFNPELGFTGLVVYYGLLLFLIYREDFLKWRKGNK